MIPEPENSFKKQNVIHEKIKDPKGFVDAVTGHRDPAVFHPEKPEALRFVCLQYIKTDQDDDDSGGGGRGLMKVSPFFTSLDDAKAHMESLKKYQGSKFDCFVLPVGRFLGWPQEACNLEETAAIVNTACLEYNGRIDEFVERRKAAKKADEEEIEKMKARDEDLATQDEKAETEKEKSDPEDQQDSEPQENFEKKDDCDDCDDSDKCGDPDEQEQEQEQEDFEPDYDSYPELVHIKQGDPAFLRRDNNEQKFAVIRYIRTLGYKKHVLLFSATAQSEDAANTIAEAIHEMRPSKAKDAPPLKSICQTCVVQTQDWVSFPPKVGENVARVYSKDNPQLEKFLTDEIQTRSDQAIKNVKDLEKWHSDRKKVLFKDEIVDVC